MAQEGEDRQNHSADCGDHSKYDRHSIASNGSCNARTNPSYDQNRRKDSHSSYRVIHRCTLRPHSTTAPSAFTRQPLGREGIPGPKRSTEAVVPYLAVLHVLPVGEDVRSVISCGTSERAAADYGSTSAYSTADSAADHTADRAGVCDDSGLCRGSNSRHATRHAHHGHVRCVAAGYRSGQLVVGAIPRDRGDLDVRVRDSPARTSWPAPSGRRRGRPWTT
jgi:hypothetical protein